MRVTAIKKFIGLTVAIVLLVGTVGYASANEIAPAEVSAPEAPSAPAHTEVTVPTAPPPVVISTAEMVTDVTPAPTEQATQTPTEEPTEEPTLEPTQEAEATPEPTQEPAYSVTIKLNGVPGGFDYGEQVELEAFLYGYEGVLYSITWECSANGVDEWLAAPGVNNTTEYEFELTEENAVCYWRAVVETA